MIIRLARLSDTLELSEILNEIIAIGGTTAYEDPLQPAYFERFITATDPKVMMHVAQTKDGVQGLQWMEPFDPPETNIGGIATFARPGTTQKGIGAALFASTKQASTQAGYTVIIAKIRADNTGGLAYYERMGFRDHSISEGEPLKDGTAVDRIIKRLAL